MNISIAPQTASLTTIDSTLSINMTATRDITGTDYQATDGARLVMVGINVTAGAAFTIYARVSPDSSVGNEDIVLYMGETPLANDRFCFTFWVPANFYYDVVGTNCTLVYWHEVTGS